MKWEPWVDFKKELEIISELTEPPCKNCSCWKPRREYINGKFDGIKCCTAPRIYFDFSCYVPKNE